MLEVTNSHSQDSFHPDDQIPLKNVTPGSKPSSIFKLIIFIKIIFNTSKKRNLVQHLLH